jgi:hypothetical protein
MWFEFLPHQLQLFSKTALQPKMQLYRAPLLVHRDSMELRLIIGATALLAMLGRSAILRLS